MGVDFSALSAYGFGVSLEDVDLFDVAPRTGYELREYEIEDRIVDDAWDLANHLIKDWRELISSDTVGNIMAGEDMHVVFYVEANSRHLDMYGSNYGSFRMHTADHEVDVIAKDALIEVFHNVYGRYPEPGEIGWFMSTTVS